jgi:hypothetical protein
MSDCCIACFVDSLDKSNRSNNSVGPSYPVKLRVRSLHSAPLNVLCLLPLTSACTRAPHLDASGTPSPRPPPVRQTPPELPRHGRLDAGCRQNFLAMAATWTSDAPSPRLLELLATAASLTLNAAEAPKWEANRP